MTAARLAPLKRAALAVFAATLLAAPALAESPAEAPAEFAGASLICGAATITSEASTEPGMVVHSSAFDSLWVEALTEAGCTQTQVGCNTCSVTESGKTICGAASCRVTTPVAVSASCAWPIADFKCRAWRDDSRGLQGGWAQRSGVARPTVVHLD